jgi:hypothetical protein
MALSTDANQILYEVMVNLSTFQSKEGPDSKWDQVCVKVVVEAAKKLTELKYMDPIFDKSSGKMVITLFRGGPMVYTFDEPPIIAAAPQVEGVTWYMRSFTPNGQPQSERIPITEKESDILWDLILKSDILWDLIHK